MPRSSVRPLPPAESPAIVLTTLNARFIHASLGLRYLLANMGDLRPQTVLREFTIARATAEIVDELLRAAGREASRAIIGFGVYIWNVQQTTAVVRRIKAERPEITVVLGGPEVSHECEVQEIVGLADYVITGWGDVSFAALCQDLLSGQRRTKIIAGEHPPLARIAFPYAEYGDADLAHRLLYVESSRGCPFKCEFCLSSLDQTAWAFDTDLFLAQIDTLYRRGARNFKFVDRTFNLKIDASVRVLQFFLDRLAAPEKPGANDLHVHFEVIPDRLPARLKELIARFPPGVLQLEIGVQTFNPDVQQRISRRQDSATTEANLRWLRAESNAHLHADLIFGLPGETLASFAHGFDCLYALRPHEIQLGLLKRLRGTPIVRHSLAFGMVYDPAPPYTVRQTAAVDAPSMQRVARFARYWELTANSGRFPRALELLLDQGHSPFAAFLDFSDCLWQRFGKTCGLAPEILVDTLFDHLSTIRRQPAPTVRAALLHDYLGSGARGHPSSLKGLLPRRTSAVPLRTLTQLSQRQARHLAGRRHPALPPAFLSAAKAIR
ncbi:MAG: DUF4080 domain-containing protein [Propionivibrio sp.]